jgi:hypothetical protein
MDLWCGPLYVCLPILRLSVKQCSEGLKSIAYPVVSVLIGIQAPVVLLGESLCSVNATPFVMRLWLRRTSE